MKIKAQPELCNYLRKNHKMTYIKRSIYGLSILSARWSRTTYQGRFSNRILQVKITSGDFEWLQKCKRETDILQLWDKSDFEMQTFEVKNVKSVELVDLARQ